MTVEEMSYRIEVVIVKLAITLRTCLQCETIKIKLCR